MSSVKCSEARQKTITKATRTTLNHTSQSSSPNMRENMTSVWCTTVALRLFLSCLPHFNLKNWLQQRHKHTPGRTLSVTHSPTHTESSQRGCLSPPAECCPPLHSRQRTGRAIHRACETVSDILLRIWEVLSRTCSKLSGKSLTKNN